MVSPAIFFVVVMEYFLSGSTALTLQEVQFVGGKAQATTTFSDWTAAKAFKYGDAKGWHAGLISNKAERFPVLIWYEFPADKTFPCYY
jgi:hypothetical protein